jgi:hypothetical protein
MREGERRPQELVEVVRAARGRHLAADHRGVPDRAGLAAMDREVIAVLAAGKAVPRQRHGGDDGSGAGEQLAPRHPRLRHV